MTFTLLGALRVQGRQVKVVDEAGEAVQDFESRLEAALTPLRFAREELELASEAWEKLPWWKKLYIPPPGVVPGLERVEVPRPPAEEVRFEINLQLADETMAKAIMRYFTDTRELTFEEAENMSLPRSQVRR